jgi:peptidoglycan/LPS O-acetylase OafA/YrhL
VTETGSKVWSPVTGRLAHLDGLRAVAALAILVYHVAVQSGTALDDGFLGALLSRGDIGVPIFFVLSGLLLYRPWAAATLDGGAPPATGRYLLRRALRILPAYWLVVALALFLWSRDRLADPADWLQVVFLLHSYNTDPWWAGSGPLGLGQMWSLTVEAAFYLTLPLLAWTLRRLAERSGTDPVRRARTLLRALCVLGAAPVAWTVLTFHPTYHPFMSMWLPRWLTYFALGMAIAVVIESAARGEPAATRWSRQIAAAAGTCWLVAAMAYGIAATPVTGPRFFGIDGMWSGLYELLLYSTVAAGLVTPVAVLATRRDRLRAVLGGRVLGFLGRISYGIFLWQFVVLLAWYEVTGQREWTGGFLVNLAAVSTITVLVAWASHRLVEEPALRLIREKRIHP